MSGSFPEYGAVFMSNRSTMKGCFEKRIFGLPHFLSDFVKAVKAGMLSFLFEYEKRQPHGAFEAISDGGMNIVPQAYASSGRQFPAQVKFTTIWHCDPLSKDEFCDAIRDNYFATCKFKFGLSKDQIQSLLWLFKSQKLKIPNSLRFNIQCEDDAYYDPKHPGFHHSTALVVLHDRAAGHEPGHASHDFVGQELVTLQVEKENFHSFSENAEDFIPLSSPDHSDPEEEGVACNEFYGEKEIEEGEFVGYTEPFFPVPQLSLKPFLSSEGFSRTKMEHSSASPHQSSCYRTEDTSYTAISLSDASDFQSKDRSNHSKKIMLKGMCSDCPNRRGSVFSRLNFAPKDMVEGNQNNASGKMEKAKPQKHEIEDCNMNKRTSVFLRLNYSEAIAQEVHCTTRLQQESGGWKKRKIEKAIVSERGYHDKMEKPVNQSQEMLASKCDKQEDSFKDDLSSPENMEKLWQRHAN